MKVGGVGSVAGAVLGAVVVVVVTVVVGGCLEPLFVGAVCGDDDDCEGALVCNDGRCLFSEGEGEDGDEGEGEEGEGEEGEGEEGEEGEGEEGEGEEGEGEAPACVDVDVVVAAAVNGTTVGVAGDPARGAFVAVVGEQGENPVLRARHVDVASGVVGAPVTISSEFPGTNLVVLDVAYNAGRDRFGVLWLAVSNNNAPGIHLSELRPDGALAGGAVDVALGIGADTFFDEIRLFAASDGWSVIADIVEDGDGEPGLEEQSLRVVDFDGVTPAGAVRDLLAGDFGTDGPMVERDGAVFLSITTGDVVVDDVRIARYDVEARALTDRVLEFTAPDLKNLAFALPSSSGLVGVFQVLGGEPISVCVDAACSSSNSTNLSVRSETQMDLTFLGDDRWLVSSLTNGGGNAIYRYVVDLVAHDIEADSFVSGGGTAGSGSYHVATAAVAGAYAVVAHQPTAEILQRADVSVVVVCDATVQP